MRRSRNLAAGLILLLYGCSMQPTARDGVMVAGPDETASCVASLAGDTRTVSRELDSRDFSVVNWNIQKGQDPDWVNDLAEVHAEPDLLIVQEASRQHEAWEVLAPGHFHSFSEGFGLNRNPSGVMTLSAAQPLTECGFVSLEPWFGTRKATLVTEYGLTDTDDTLLVVNIHGINFTFGIRDLEDQFRKAQAVIAAHEGPVLFSGDFNTWRGKRAQMLEKLVREVGLTPLEFSADHRKRFLGWPLDHIYKRGLDTIHATTRDLTSSDHNPMAVRFRLTDEPILSEGPGRIAAAP